MTDMLRQFGVFLDVVRRVFLGLAVVAGALSIAAWAVRVRRVSPFGMVGRFVRTSVDPLLRPVERVVLRAGGTPATAPWWGLVFLLVAGVLVIATLNLLAGVLLRIVWGFQDPARLPVLLLSFAFAVIRIALIVRVLSSWFPISPFSRWIRWSFVITEWMIGPLRRLIPPIGAIDATPLVAYFGLWLLQSVLNIP